MHTNSNPEIRINPAYARLVPPLSPEEIKSLNQSIKEIGLLVPIVVNQRGTILDGHHRYRACQELGIEAKTIVRESNDNLDEELFVIKSNLIRRQLNPYQRTELALKTKPMLEAIVKRNESLAGKGDRNLTPLGRVDETIGEMACVSRDTVRKVQKLMDSGKLDAVREALRLGELSINEAYGVVALKEELYQKLRKAREELDNSLEQKSNQQEQEPNKLQDDEKLWDDLARPYRNYLEKRFEYEKAYAAYYFWIENQSNGTSDIEYAASRTLEEILARGVENGVQTLSRQSIAEILLHAAAENKVNVDRIKDSRVLRSRLVR